MNLAQFTAAVRFTGTVYSTDDNHMDIHLEIIHKLFLTPWQRRDPEKWEIARGWLETHWDEYMAKAEDGFLYAPEGRFMTREETFACFPPEVQKRIKEEEARTWADASDFYTL